MGSEQQYCLKWNNHHSTILGVFDTLLEEESLVDVILSAEGQFLKAHRVILSACSPYFRVRQCSNFSCYSSGPSFTTEREINRRGAI